MKRILRYFCNMVTGAGISIVLLWSEFFWWLKSPSGTVPAWSLYLVELVALMLACAFYAIFRYRYDTSALVGGIPVRYIGSASTCDGWIILVDDVPVLGINRFVSVCFESTDNDVQDVIAVGYVESKNDKGKYQILIQRNRCFCKGDLSQLGKKSLSVRPFINKDDIGE